MLVLLSAFIRSFNKQTVILLRDKNWEKDGAMSRQGQSQTHSNSRVRPAEVVPGNLTPRYYLIKNLSQLSLNKRINIDVTSPYPSSVEAGIHCCSGLERPHWYLVDWYNVFVNYRGKLRSWCCQCKVPFFVAQQYANQYPSNKFSLRLSIEAPCNYEFRWLRWLRPGISTSRQPVRHYLHLLCELAQLFKTAQV